MLGDISNWADEVKSDPGYRWSGRMHYVNAPRDAADLDFDRDCPEQGCVIQGIVKYANVLRDKNASATEQVEALSFLVHLVGDLHQPLHVGFADDRGGNDVQVQYFGRHHNLHFLWDISLLAFANKASGTYAAELYDRFSLEQLDQWQNLEVMEWANESRQFVLSQVYDIPPDGKLGKEYFEHNLPVAEERLAQAGVRLAHLLNTIFGAKAELPFVDLASAFGHPQLVVGSWRAVLDCPGGELPFGLEISRAGLIWRAWLINGDQRSEIPRVSYLDGELVLDIEHYDSVIRARVSTNGAFLCGEWKKRTGPQRWAILPFQAEAGRKQRFKAYRSWRAKAPSWVNGRWEVRFAGSKEPAVGVFETRDDGEVLGTFLTATGDYGHLAGKGEGNHLRLSNFDGCHAFLFEAYLQPDGVMQGNFWSRDSWHETWIAKSNSNARLPDAFKMTSAKGQMKLADLSFPDLQGVRRSLAGTEFAGKAYLIEIFGSWCPNCHDASRYLAELDQRYRARGLSIIGLAFELTGNFERDAQQVRRFVKRCGVQYPMLLAGKTGQDSVAAALPMLGRLRAYPTVIFLDSRGEIRAVHTGFSGPATGEAYLKVQTEFEKLIDDLLSESASPEK